MAGRKQTQDPTSGSLWATLTTESFIITELRLYQSQLADKLKYAWSASSLQRFQHWLADTSFRTGSYTASRGEQTVITFQRWIRNAWGYKRVTAEPEPDIIVIDLQDTIVVGPILHLLGLLVPHQSRVVQTIDSLSHGVTAILDGARSLEALRECRVVKLVRALFEPPAPPERKLHDEETTMSENKEEPSSKTER